MFCIAFVMKLHHFPITLAFRVINLLNKLKLMHSYPYHLHFIICLYKCLSKGASFKVFWKNQNNPKKSKGKLVKMWVL